MNDASEPDADVPGYEYARIADDIAARIEAGNLTPGAKLPSLSDLGEEYGVARNTAQRAIKELRKRGLVKVVLYKGTFIATRD